MGNWFSGRKTDGKRDQNGSKEKVSKQVDIYKDAELMLLRRAIENDPKSFILNNLMMCMQFFENYEEDKIHIKRTLASAHEDELNKVLPPQKHVLLPDVLQKYIAHNVAFTSQRQTNELINEPLQPIRIYIVHDNIEITEKHYQPEYGSLNNEITYNMMVQPCEHAGYVRLRYLDKMPYLSKENIDSLSNADDDEIYDGDGESVYGRNSNMMVPQQIKEGDPQTSRIFKVKSMPNLCDDGTIYEHQISLSRKDIYGSRSNNDIKSDCERASSRESRMSHGKKLWPKNDMAVTNSNYQRRFRSGTAQSAKQKVHRPASSSSSGYRSGACDSDSDWSYQTVTKMPTNRNVHQDKTSAGTPTKIYSNAMIPMRCFKKVRIDSEGNIYMMRREQKPQNSKQFRLLIADRQYDCDVFYTNSEIFMDYFVDLFVDQIAEPLGFNSEDLDHVKDSVIYCERKSESHSTRERRIDSYEITPAIWLQWPEYVQEWLDRPRTTWPNYNDVNQVKDFGCYVIPENSFSRRNVLSRKSWHQDVKKDINQDIEWQLTFPAAERYLELCMTHSQVQVYLMALMLHKTFLRPILDSMYGLTISHIRNKLFWLIEENDRPSKWPDNRTGECLIKLLKSLESCIRSSKPTLPDYFMPDKNMFDKVPHDYLLHSQKQLKRIIDNPVMYVFHAMENIKPIDKYFPQLDLEKLYKILTVRPWLAVINPSLDMPPLRSTENRHREEIYNNSNRYWNQAQIKNRENVGSPINRTLITPRKATDCIVEISERCVELESPRLAALLDFFVCHFIKIAECYHRYRADEQKKIYLDQADRLSIILSEMNRPSCKEDAIAYRNKIYALRMRTTTKSQNEPPETPKRNLQEPVFSGTLKDRFTRQFAELLTQPRDKQRQSSHEDVSSIDVTTTATVHEVQFKNKEKTQENESNATTSEDEGPYSSTKPIAEDRSDESNSDTIQKVISLSNHLNGATYI